MPSPPFEHDVLCACVRRDTRAPYEVSSLKGATNAKRRAKHRARKHDVRVAVNPYVSRIYARNVDAGLT
jgi:hypothetical protein